MKRLMFLFLLMIVATSVVSPSAQQSRPPSPPGTATTVVGGQWTKNAQGNPTYEGGKWIEVTYSRPMLRARMEVTSNPSRRIDLLTIFFVDVTQNSGKLAIAWDTTTATVPFKVGR